MQFVQQFRRGRGPQGAGAVLVFSLTVALLPAEVLAQPQTSTSASTNQSTDDPRSFATRLNS